MRAVAGARPFDQERQVELPARRDERTYILGPGSPCRSRQRGTSTCCRGASSTPPSRVRRPGVSSTRHCRPGRTSGSCTRRTSPSGARTVPARTCSRTPGHTPACPSSRSRTASGTRPPDLGTDRERSGAFYRVNGALVSLARHSSRAPRGRSQVTRVRLRRVPRSAPPAPRCVSLRRRARDPARPRVRAHVRSPRPTTCDLRQPSSVEVRSRV